MTSAVLPDDCQVMMTFSLWCLKMKSPAS